MRKLEDKGFGSKPERYIYLGTNPNNYFSYYYYPSTNSIETFNGSIEGGNHMSYSKSEEFFVSVKPIDSAMEMLRKLGCI